MLIPRPLESFFSSMTLSSFLAGDFAGDLAGVFLASWTGDLAGLLLKKTCILVPFSSISRNNFNNVSYLGVNEAFGVAAADGFNVEP